MTDKDEAAILTDLLKDITIQRLEAQVSLYRDVVDRVRQTIPLLAADGEAHDNALMIISRLCDICEDIEGVLK